MKFFTEAELEEIYGVSITEVSPTDQPKEQYMVGQETVTCPQCGTQLESECVAKQFSGGSSPIDGFVERVFCESCHLEGERTRDPISDDIDYQYQHNRVDEREEYVCEDCYERHPFTVPEGEFEFADAPSIQSLESIDISCLCGAVIHMGDIEFDELVSCPDCPREYSFEMVVEMNEK